MDFRIGKVSSIDYSSGMISVYYPGVDNVTNKLPMIANKQYNMPEIGDEVVVLHKTDNPSVGVVLGTVWNAQNKPLEASPQVFCLQLEKNKAYIKYNKETGILTIKAPIVKTEEGGTE